MSADGPDAVAAIADVSRETLERLGVFVDLIRRWNTAENLVSGRDMDAVWTRHIADCTQLPGLLHGLPATARHWVDIGSGAGLPGIVIALVAPAGTRVDLIESNQRKCAFLRTAIRETGAPAAVHQGRAEDVLVSWAGPAEVVTARAVAPLGRLLSLARPLFDRGAVGLFPKGRGYREEIDEASLIAGFDLLQHASRIDPDAAILEIRNVRWERPSATRG